MILLTGLGFGAHALFGFREGPVLGVVLGFVLARFVPVKSACSIDSPPREPE